MKESTLTATEFKAKCLRLLDDVANQGDSIIITKRGRPIAKVEPVSRPGKTLRGTWKGIVKGDADIVYFNVADEWESAR